MSLLCCSCISLADIIALGGVLISLGLLGVTYYIYKVGKDQLINIGDTKKIEFTYGVYMDFFNFLNDKNNEKLKDWFYDMPDSEIEVNSRDWIKIGQLLEKFEAVAVLKNRNALDLKVFYELIGFYIEEVFEYPTHPTTDEYIEHERKEAGEKEMAEPGQLYSGTLALKRLLKEMDEIEKNKT